MIYFDKKMLKLLKFIYRRKDKGAKWDEIIDKFKKDGVGPLLLEQLSTEHYIATSDADGDWITMDESNFRSFPPGMKAYILPRGSELLEKRCFNFWKWVIPTIISVIALVISSIGLLCR